MSDRVAPDPYDHPRYWDLAFRDETQPEADFLEAVAVRYLSRPLRRILEPACGGGRQVLELARRGYNVTGFDLNPECVRYVRQRLKRAKSAAKVIRADMTRFTAADLLPDPALNDDRTGFEAGGFDLAHCLVNSFRHLTTEQDAVSHLNSVASVLAPGGLYVLGFHLLPPDAAEEDCERWTLTYRGLRITTTVRVLEFSRRRRIERVRFSLRIRSPKLDVKLRTDHDLRIYRADQFRSLLGRVPALRLLDVYDFCYDLSEPLRLNDELGDTVFVLQKTSLS